MSSMLHPFCSEPKLADWAKSMVSMVLALIASSCTGWVEASPTPYAPSHPPSYSDLAPSNHPIAEMRVSASLVDVIRRQCSQVPLGLVLAIIEVESGFNPRAYSSAGAIGLMQVMPFHARKEENLWDVEDNIRVGCRVLMAEYQRAISSPYLWHRRNPWRTALAAYNAGWVGATKKGKGWEYAQRVLHIACSKHRVCLR